jgi:hypothetical protein
MSVEKQTLKTLKQDPVTLERLVRHNREAEINHFVNLVKMRAEREDSDFARYTSVEVEIFEKDWIDANRKLRKAKLKEGVDLGYEVCPTKA